MQPIDLQTMYSQLSNVSKAVAGQQQTAQLANSFQQQTQVQKNLENSIKIQRANEKPDTQNVNEDGSNGGTYQGQNKKQNKKEQDVQTSTITTNISTSNYLGTIIDITR